MPETQFVPSISHACVRSEDTQSRQNILSNSTVPFYCYNSVPCVQKPVYVRSEGTQSQQYFLNNTTAPVYCHSSVPQSVFRPPLPQYHPYLSIPDQQIPVSQPPQQQQLDAWMTIADAIKQGPSLPKLELLKFSGDPTEYSEFVTNFIDNVECRVSEDSQRLTRLLAQCTGKAKEAIRSCVNLPEGVRYSEARKTLQENFGQPHMVADAHLKRLKELQLKRADAPSLMDFARRLEDTQRTLTSMGHRYVNRLDNEDTIIMLMRKLPEESLKRKWADKAGDLIKAKGQAEYTDFVNFIRKTANRLNNRFGQELKFSIADRSLNSSASKNKEPLVTTLGTKCSEEKPNSISCPKCCGRHGVWRCQSFKSASLPERFKIVKQHKLCRRCLAKGHFAKACDKNFTCRKAGCGKEHHYLLHNPSDDTSAEQPSNASQSKSADDTSHKSYSALASKENTAEVITKEPSVTSSGSSVQVNAVGISRPRVCFKVVPVKVSGPGSDKQITTYAFLDSGSDTTLCLDSLVQELGINSVQTNFVMATVNHEGKKSGLEVQLNIESLTSEANFQLDHVLTTNSLPVTTKHFATKNDVKKWPHLIGVDLPEIDSKKVTILIGSDRSDIIDNELDKRIGKKGQPFAVKTPLGWTVFGPVGDTKSNEIYCNFAISEQDTSISAQLERMYNSEFRDSLTSATPSMSVEDLRANSVMDKTAHLVNGHYQIQLPFRKDPPSLPVSLPMAKKRLCLLKKRLEKDEKCLQQYTRAIEKYESEGSARRVPDEEVAKLSPIWYLPHHAVFHPRKPNEPRIVFDCAAKSNGTSLNAELLQGPDNTSTLIGVINRFRVNDVAVAADVKRMFHQVYVAPEHRGALCYLWWPKGDLKHEAKTHQMLVHIFGATSSPSIAGYALRKTAKDNEPYFSSEAVDAVLRDFYVDDLLKSFSNAEQAITTAKEIQQLLAKGGFQLTKWISNDRDVMSAFPADERAPTVKNLDLKSDELPVDRALGIHWNTEKDTFNLVARAREYPKNRRGVLSSISTIYDPLGFASPLLLPGREINQALCRLKYDWNEDLPPDLLARWNEWKEGLETLNNYSIRRCFRPEEFGKVTRAELHHFADASEHHGYGTASYLRLVDDKGRIHCSFVMGKSRVKPLRSGISVPKLELTAATLAIQINELITKELQFRLNIDSIHFWTDSVIVLKYIQNESRRFTTFVTNRVAVIREGSEPYQWKYVKSEMNPADHASRGIKPSEKEKLETWRNGPAFLWKNTDEWPQQPPEASAVLSDDDEGVRKEKLTVNTAVVRNNFWNSLFERYSSWNKLVRTVAWTIRACKKWYKLCSDNNHVQCTNQLNQPLSVSDMHAARRQIMNIVQRESYPEEFEFASSPTKSVRRKGKLAALKPFVAEGILRVGGRLGRSELSQDAKHPMIIPGKHRVTELFILHVHQTNGHVGAQQVLARTRQQFWIVKGVSSVRRMLRRCHECKRQSARLGTQVTAPLPVVRVSSDTHRLIYPFAAVGLDYFGPFYVKHGPVTRTASRNPTLNKRYGCIFTCLRYRAVHIEVAHDLTTDSFINAVLRFVARRGPPRIIYSDNGSNFTGAESDVLKALKAWDQNRIQRDLCERDIEWKFNPPAASHQGGVWERLIRSIRRILHSMIGERLVDDETLATFLVEVEKIMNDRPITPVSSDSNDLEALTPNQVLLLRQNPCVAPDDFSSADQYRTRWKHVQILANRFWQRWMREYLPTLQERQKWLDQQPNLRKGDLVLVANQNVPRGKWPKGLVEQTYPDSDGVVRRVLVRTAEGVAQRDIRKLCLLEENLLKLLELQSLPTRRTITHPKNLCS